jgi:hypothetical protein
MKLEIRARESAVADEEHVAEALGNFSKLFEVMSFDERRELMGLLIKNVSVSRFNPETDRFTCDKSVFQNQPSTKWYRLDFDFHIRSMFAAGNAVATPLKTPCTTDAETESRNGDRASEPAEIRTRMSQSILVGVVSSDWANGSFVVHPFQTDRAVMDRTANRKRFNLDSKKHILATAMEWKAIMDGDVSISSAVVARETGITSGRARQIIRLTRLQPGIQETLLAMPLDKSKAMFPESVLLLISAKPWKTQIEEFGKLMKSFGATWSSAQANQ